MGLVLKVDLDTSGGSTKEAYIRIETCRINKVQAQLEFTTTCWINKKAAGKFYRKYLDDPLTNAGGLIKKEVVYYKDENGHWHEFICVKGNESGFCSHHFQSILAYGIEVEILMTNGLSRAQVYEVRAYS